MTANPTGLAEDQTHIATVTISSSDPDVENQETIRIAFWAGATDPQNESVNISRHNIIANPVEPWVYVTNDGNTIEIYNVYSGALVNTWTTAIPAVGDMAISQDGTLLFRLGRVSQAPTRELRESLPIDFTASIAAWSDHSKPLQDRKDLRRLVDFNVKDYPDYYSI